jgi:NitT/TauT family transport system ATP-binding protein
LKDHGKVISLDNRKQGTVRQEIIFKVSGLGKVFPVANSFLTVLDDVHFQVSRGEFVCILGRSGCGKTTLLNILAGFVPPSSGAVLLNGNQVSHPGPDRCVVFQENTLFPWLTVHENVAFGLKGGGLTKRAIRDEVCRFLSLVGLSEFGSYLPREISGGMKQRVALARVLILRPDVLLMDEPFASLDAQTREEMQKLLLVLWKQLAHTILFVTHDVAEAVTLCDRVLVMRKSPGRIQQELKITLPRPRRREDERFIAFSRQLYEVLRD